MPNSQIVLVGEQLMPIYLGIKEFMPEEIHFIATKESKPKADLLTALLKDKKIRWHICSAFNYESILSSCNDAIAASAGSQVLFNLTGGTKVMMLAAQQAMLDSGTKGFYIIQNDETLLLPEFKTQPIHSVIGIGEFIKLSNHEGEYTPYQQIAVPDIQAAWLVYEFVQRNPSVYKKLGEVLPQMNLKRPGAYSINRNLSTSWDAQKFVVNQRGNRFEINTTNYGNILFNGSWWELAIAQQLIAWAKTAEVGINCILKFRSDQKTRKNEIDVLLNLGRRLIFIECKSGAVSTKNIDRMIVTRNTYGDSYSKALLVKYEKPSKVILNLCREAGIGVFYCNEKGRQVNDLTKLNTFIDNYLNQ